MHFYVNKISKHTIILVFIFIIQSSPSIVSASETHLNESDKQFSFAEALFAEGDYYRAITEYKRFSFLFPDNKLVEKSTYRIAESFFKATRWQEAVNAFSSFTIKYPQSSMIIEALYHKGMAEKHLKRLSDALSTFQEITKLKSSELTDKAVYQSVIILMEMEEWQKARKALHLISPSSPLYPSANTISSGIERMDDMPQKSPLAAGTLAAIIPGAGHLYMERPIDAFVSFLLNGAFILAAVELFHHDNYVAGGIVSFFEVGWYTGNIYSAVNSAHKYNKKTKEDFIQNLIDKSSVSFMHDPKTSADSLIFSFHF